MGGQHSRLSSDDDAVQNPRTDEHASTTTNLCQSRNDTNSPCFLLDKIRRWATQGTKSNDPIGSPLPDTPVYQRQRRQQVHDALRGGGGGSDVGGGGNVNKVLLRGGSDGGGNVIMYMSMEGSSLLDSTNSSISRPGTMLIKPMDSMDEARIYEGPDVEQLLHAKYQLMEVIGVGSTSSVHRCVNRATDQEYACKIIDCQLIEDRFHGMMGQFLTEIEALKQLQHPNIIRLYNVYITGSRIYIIMELMEGGELFDYVVQKGTLTEDEASVIVRKVTSALVYMHDKNIVHRDLKPENLLLKKKPKGPNDEIEIKIIDFGLSKALMEEPVARTFLGTRGYLAPEMLQRRTYDRAVDAWALGVIVFVLLCGCLPFDDDSATVPSDDLVRARFHLRFPRWAKNLSASAKNLLSHLLDVNPVTRFTADQALRHPWVQGQTAPKGNLLASPGRIRKSPMLSGSHRPPPPPTPPLSGKNFLRGPSNAGNSSNNGSSTAAAMRSGRGNPETPPTPQPPGRGMPRKTSF